MATTYDALSLLEDMAALGHPFLEVGITGYPEGHPVISPDRLRQSLLEKQTLATYVVTQMCFSPETIVDWIASIRADGVTLPIKVGVPGAVDPTRLLTIGARIGVGDSMRFLSKNRGSILGMLRPGRYQPDRIIEPLARLGEGLRMTGIHIFTFNQVEPTVAWHRRSAVEGDLMAVQSIDRAFQVLKALAVEPSGVTELASRVGLPKSTVARMLSSLEDQGAVTRGPDGTSYAIGIGLVELAGAIDATAALATAVRPHLVWLSDQLGEAAGFSIPTGYTIQYMVQVESPNPVQVRDYTGLIVPMHIGPSGLCVMAQWPAEEVDRYLSRPLEAYTTHTVVDAGGDPGPAGGDQGLGPLLDP